MRAYLPEETSRSIAVRDERPSLPAATSLSPDAATAVGSRLLAGDQLHAAIPYLMRGVGEPTNAFGWRRLGALCHRLGYPGHAVTCFDRSLALEPGERYGLVGLSKALADWPEAMLAELVEVAGDLVSLLREPDPAPVAYVISRTVREIARRCPHPAIRQLAHDLHTFARQCDGRTDQDRTSAIESRLDAVLRAADLVGCAPRQGYGPRGRLTGTERQAALNGAEARRALAPPA
jgi:hypothetical protein